jgi:hypothetical protein
VEGCGRVRVDRPRVVEVTRAQGPVQGPVQGLVEGPTEGAGEGLEVVRVTRGRCSPVELAAVVVALSLAAVDRHAGPGPGRDARDAREGRGAGVGLGVSLVRAGWAERARGYRSPTSWR